jgi:hypothetical protein
VLIFFGKAAPQSDDGDLQHALRELQSAQIIAFR